MDKMYVWTTDVLLGVNETNIPERDLKLKVVFRVWKRWCIKKTAGHQEANKS